MDHGAASGFLTRIDWREAWVTLQAMAPAELPPYLGSTLRGALGHLLRSELCDGSGCGHECQQQGECRYFSLFERSRSADGRNLPKPLILMAPVSPALETAAMGGPVNPPLRTAPPRLAGQAPVLRDESRISAAAGETIRFGLRIVGPAAAALPAMVGAMARHGLELAGCPFQLRSADDGAGAALFDSRFPTIPPQLPPLRRLGDEPARTGGGRVRRIRVVFLSPMVLKSGEEAVFDAERCAARFFEHAMAQAAKFHEAVGEARLPWLDAPAVEARLTGHRLFRYALPRRSYRQDQWLDFDGLVGYLDLEGDLTAGMPYARAAETLHFGQKATFGLGRTRVFVMEE